MIHSVIGLFFGDEGKGHTVNYLTEKHNATANVRFSGGSQAAHRVVKDGVGHVFAQFGSGSVSSPYVKTFLSSQMAVNPINLMVEADVHHANGIANLYNRLYIDPECPLITPFHVALNQARELVRGEDRISTTGMGVGEVFDDERLKPQILIRAKDLLDDLHFGVGRKIIELRKLKEKEVEKLGGDIEFYREQTSFTDNEYLRSLTYFPKDTIKLNFNELLLNEMGIGDIILEGSQGTLLDMDFGTKPWITRSSVALPAADKLLSMFPEFPRNNIGVMRGYLTRHGIGPMPSEDEKLTESIPDSHNVYGEWQRNFRVGWLDLSLLKYSLECNKGLNSLVITNLDRTPEDCYYFWEGNPTPIKRDALMNLVNVDTGLPVIATSWGEQNSWR